jgi:hypothetical protein
MRRAWRRTFTAQDGKEEETFDQDGDIDILARGEARRYLFGGSCLTDLLDERIDNSSTQHTAIVLLNQQVPGEHVSGHNLASRRDSDALSD